MATVGGSQANDGFKFGHVEYELFVGCGSGRILLLVRYSGWPGRREPWVLDENGKTLKWSAKL